MKESLTFGVPFGMLSGLIFFLSASVEMPVLHFGRQIFVLSIGLWAMFYETKKANSAYFPYRYAWFSGFNTLFVMALVSAVLVLLVKSNELEELSITKDFLAMGFVEFFNLLFLGVLINTALAWVFRKK